MAKFKKATKKTTKNASGAKADARVKAERLSKSLSESAQQIWQAGVGAFGRAQEEGSKLFEGLVKEGLNLEQSARKFAGGRAEVVRDVVETGVGQARDRATDTWDRLESVFEDRVQRALNRLGVPGRDDLNELTDRVEELTGELRRQHGKATNKSATRAPAKTSARSTKAAPARKAAPAKKAASSKAATKKAATKKAATKKVRSKTAKATVGRKAASQKTHATTTPAVDRKAATKATTKRARKSIVATPVPVAPAAPDA